MMTRPKPDGSRRLIVNLSWPVRASVNGAIPYNIFDDRECILKYPRLDNIVNAVYWTCTNMDDIVGVSPPNNTSSAFLSLNNLITLLGLPINKDKVFQPVDELTCYVLNLDVKSGTLTIPSPKNQGSANCV